MYTTCEQQASEACKADVHGMQAVRARLKTCEALGRGEKGKGLFYSIKFASRHTQKFMLLALHTFASISHCHFECREGPGDEV